MDQDLLTPREVARELRVTERTVYNWLYQGQLNGLKAGRFWRIQRSALDCFLSLRDTRSSIRSSKLGDEPQERVLISESSAPQRLLWSSGPNSSVLGQLEPFELLESPLLAEKTQFTRVEPGEQHPKPGLTAHQVSDNAVLCLAGQPRSTYDLSCQRRCTVCNNILSDEDERCPGRHAEGPVQYTLSWFERPLGPGTSVR